MIIIPMAGLSSRFTKAGYDRPKWMLPLDGRPLLDWSLLGFQKYFEEEELLIIHLDHPGVRDFIEDRVRALSIKRDYLVALSEVTRGQAETVYAGMKSIGTPKDDSILIFNIDTIRPRFRKPDKLETSDGWLECFKGDGDHWSFVRESKNAPGMAAQVTEKQRISENCCTGMYYFKSGALFEKYYLQELSEEKQTELYVAPIYQRMIDDGLSVSFDVIRPEEIIFSGTPQEYEDAKRNAASIASKF